MGATAALLIRQGIYVSTIRMYCWVPAGPDAEERMRTCMRLMGCLRVAHAEQQTHEQRKDTDG